MSGGGRKNMTEEVRPMVTREQRSKIKSLYQEGEQILHQIGRLQRRIYELNQAYDEKQSEYNREWAKIRKKLGLDPKKRYNIAPDGTIVEWGNDFSTGGESP